MAVLRYARALFESFYSARFYRAVRHEWRGAGIIYLLFLSLIAQLPTAVKSTWELHQWNLDHRGQAFLQRIPEFRTGVGNSLQKSKRRMRSKIPKQAGRPSSWIRRVRST